MSSLGIILEQTREQIKDTVNMIFLNKGIPAYLREGIILELLSDVREQKNKELMIEYNEEIRKMKENYAAKDIGTTQTEAKSREEVKGNDSVNEIDNTNQP
jgi:hypothetical protein